MNQDTNQEVTQLEQIHIEKGMVMIYEKLDKMFTDKEHTHTWMTSKNRNFGFKTPLEVTQEGLNGVYTVLEYIQCSVDAEGS